MREPVLSQRMDADDPYGRRGRRNILPQYKTDRLATRLPKIYVIDDAVCVLEIIEVALRPKFKSVILYKYEDSTEAWRALLQEDPRLLIMRDRMPGLTGQEIVRRLVAMKKTYPVIVGGGWPPTEKWVRKISAQNPNINYLRYPFTAEQLWRSLRECGLV